jgi:predicted peptidase
MRLRLRRLLLIFCGAIIPFFAIALAIVWANTGAALRMESTLADELYGVPEALINACDALQFTVRREGQQNSTLDYRLFKPLNPKKGEQYPLIVWLHGHGPYEKNFHNIGQLKGIGELVIRDLGHLDSYEFYLLAVQCPMDLEWSTRIGDYDPIDANLMIVEHLIQTLPIDHDRVTVLGISSGGRACWDMTLRRPDLFAAVAPIACVPPMSGKLRKIVDIPVWVFRSKADTEPPMQYVHSTIERLHQLGGRCTLTETNTHTHDCWTTAFLDYDLLDWLLAQHKSDLNSPLPGSQCIGTRIHLLLQSCMRITTWWSQACAVAVMALIIVVVAREWSKTVQGETTAIVSAPELVDGK